MTEIFKAEKTIFQIEIIRDLLLQTNSIKQVMFYDWLLANGKSFKGRKLTKKEEFKLTKLLSQTLYKPKHCFYNAQMICFGNSFKYYEGFAQTEKLESIFDHAWLVKDGEIFDPTWKDGAEYFGVEIPKEVISRNIGETGAAQPLLVKQFYMKMENENVDS